MSKSKKRRYLSAPTVAESDIQSVKEALESEWLAPKGPDLTRFEHEIAQYIGVEHAVGLSSGTAAIHLGLKYLGVSPGDLVLVPTLTFGATAFAVTYLGAKPIFIDVDDSWNMDPDMTERSLNELRSEGQRVAAALPVDLYGNPANYAALSSVMSKFNVPMFEDAAEGLGGSFGDRMLGGFGVGSALSFNGNKILTTSGGGMLVTNDSEFAAKVRFWATQSREDFPWYEHHEIGYNYRLSNILAALGHSQLNRIDKTVARRRELRNLYRSGLAATSGVDIQDDPHWGVSNAWLTVVTFHPSEHPNVSEKVRLALEEHDIESRPIWKPMHLQPVFKGARSFLSGNANAIYSSGLCLPSGMGITDFDVEEICFVISQTLTG